MIQFSKLMVEKVYEIRRQSPPELKSKIKMSSPALFEDLQTYYTGEQVGSLSKSIEDLFSLANKHLSTGSVEDEANYFATVKPKTKMYRGVAIKDEKNDKGTDDTPKGRKIIYRGQVTYVA